MKTLVLDLGNPILTDDGVGIHKDVITFGETCTPHVQAAIPRVAQMVLEEIL